MTNDTNDKEYTTTRKIAMALYVASVLVLMALSIMCTMLLWNWLMPDIFGVVKIDFLQTTGILLLAYLVRRGLGLQISLGIE